jgi:hypothetical protein
LAVFGHADDWPAQHRGLPARSWIIGAPGGATSIQDLSRVGPERGWVGACAVGPEQMPELILQVARGPTRHSAEWHELASRPEVVIATLLAMTSYQPAVAPRISPAKLAIAGALTTVLSIALIFGGSLFAAVIPAAEPVIMVTSVLGRVLVIAGIVLIVLAVVRRFDRR